MMTLKERVLAERNAEVRCVDRGFDSVSMVTFCPWQAREWTLPWARLDALSFFDEEGSERVELFFPHHQVIVIGENLRKIMDDIRNFQVSLLRDLPESHRARLTPGAVFIAQLEVRVLADPKTPLGQPFPADGVSGRSPLPDL
jgi:hypothetical protein